jgi:hypothetical protein
MLQGIAFHNTALRKIAKKGRAIPCPFAAVTISFTRIDLYNIVIHIEILLLAQSDQSESLRFVLANVFLHHTTIQHHLTPDDLLIHELHLLQAHRFVPRLYAFLLMLPFGSFTISSCFLDSFSAILPHMLVLCR